MKRYRVFVPVVRWEEWLVDARDEADACQRVTHLGQGKKVGEQEDEEIGVGTYAAEDDDTP